MQIELRTRRCGGTEFGRPWSIALATVARWARRILLGAIAVSAPTPADPGEPLLDRVLRKAGVECCVQDPHRILDSPTRARQLPLLRALVRDPLQAAYRVGAIESAYREALDSPVQLMAITANLAGVEITRSPRSRVLDAIERQLADAADPLDAALRGLVEGVAGVEAWRPNLPRKQELPSPLRHEIAMVVAAIGHANRHRMRALAELPADLSSQQLAAQVIGIREAPVDADLRRLLPRVDQGLLMAGMLDLVASVERLDRFLAHAQDLPKLAWQLDTPLGTIVIDTTGVDNHHDLHDPLFVLDVGGDDHYRFERSDDPQRGRISVVVDVGGGDRYTAAGPGDCASSGILGYGILWDTDGDDRYEGGMLAQAAAVFGAALLYDGGGRDAWQATGYSQAYAFGGAALLVSGGGDDTFHALTHAQGAGGPEGAAVLVNAHGNDRYVLGNDPLLVPSSQLPARNVSMGQGAGYGIRADLSDGRSTTGGVGVLLDFEGDDHYQAQVFAQGAGYWEGVGLLVDGGGNDTFEAAWYALGAAAHHAAGVFISRGDGMDRYVATHSTSLGAAHDFSVAMFVDEGGDDHYRLGRLGFGAASDNSTGVFVDLAGDDRYELVDPACTAFGAAVVSRWGTLREDLPSLGLFLDLGGRDDYPDHCSGPANDSIWTWPRQQAEPRMRSEAGAGFDGLAPLPPFRIRLETERTR